MYKRQALYRMILESFNQFYAKNLTPYIKSVSYTHLIETTVRSQRNVALGREHDFYFHSSFHSILQCLFEFMTQGEVGADNLDAVLCLSLIHT